MSDGSYGRIRNEPLQNVGAQDILRIGYNFYGFLRKKRRWDNLTGRSRWKQRFVVLSEGCLYCFYNESARKPIAAFSLCFYENAHELFLKIPHCFQVVHEEAGRSALIFSCESKERQRLWIEHLKDCIEQCGKLSACSSNLSDQSVDEGIVADKNLEKRSLPPAPPIPQRPGKDTGPPTAQSLGAGISKTKRYKETARSEYDLESEEEDNDDDMIYDDILDDDDQGAAMKVATGCKTLPGRVQVLPDLSKLQLGTRPKSVSSRPPVPLPVTSRSKSESSDESSNGDLPDYENIFKTADYIFDSNDRDMAKQNLIGRPDGTFLVRKSRSSASKVLSVVANGDVKEFQITEDGSKMSIDKVQFFPTLDSLLNYYYQKDLPKNDYKMKLKKGYMYTGK